MFVNTCGGDQNPLPRRTVELCEKYGNMLADAVEEVLKKPLKPVAPGLRTAFEYVDLPYEKVVTREDLQAAAKDANAIKKRWAERLLKQLDAGEKFAAAYPYPIHAWRLGKDTLMIGMGAETVVDYALRVQGRVRARHLGVRVRRRHDLLHPLAPGLARGRVRGRPEPVRVRPARAPLGRRRRNADQPAP